MTDDLWLALDFHARGLTVTTSAAITTSEEPAAPEDQWERRVRIAHGLLSEALPRTGSLARTPVGRHYLAHKLYRITVGPAAFWTAAVTLMSLRPSITVPAVGLPVAAAVAQYRGLTGVRTPLDPMVAVVAMQAVPVAALLRIVRRRLDRRGQPSPGWRKVPR
jgi:hypothetical protein